jgi:site-specific recombinase XerD
MSRYKLESNSPFLTSVIRSFKAVGMKESTQRTYIRWIREFLAYFGNVRHPKDISEADVAQFVTHIAVDLDLGYSSQNQALCALVHMYKYVVRKPLGDMDNLLWSKKPKKLPSVYSKKDITDFLAHLDGDIKLMVKLALCTGLRISECCQLTVGALDMERGVIRVISGKGDKDRETYLPAVLEAEMVHALNVARSRYEQDLIRELQPNAQPKPFERAKDLQRQFIFTPENYRWNANTKSYGRFPYSRQYVRKVFNQSLKDAGIGGKGSFHTLRHTFATHYYHHGMNIRELQILLGHSSVETTQIYTHILGGMRPIVSPIDSDNNG